MMDNNLLTIGGTLMAILTIVSRILLFRKAGRSFWLAVIPVVSRFTEYNICWKGGVVVLQAMFVAIAAGCAASGEEAALVAGAIFLGLAMIVQLIECLKLAKAFGKGTGCGILLFVFGRLGRILLGLGDAQYVRRDERETRRAGYSMNAA